MTFIVNRLGPRFPNGPFAAEFLGANLHERPTDELVSAFEDAMATYAVVVGEIERFGQPRAEPSRGFHGIHLGQRFAIVQG